MTQTAKRNSRPQQTKRLFNPDGSRPFVPHFGQIAEAQQLLLKAKGKTDFGTHQVCVTGYTRRIIRGKEQIRQAAARQAA